MKEQKSLGQITPSKKYATDAWKKACELVAVLEAEEEQQKQHLKATLESLKEARAVEKSTKTDLLRLLDTEEGVLPGLVDRGQPG